jgi:hypothetical protein
MSGGDHEPEGEAISMRALTLSLTVATVVLAMCLQVGTAHAQATRTWISGVGDDANPCSRTAPCKTFAGAISKTSAGGEIDNLDTGGFGALTITKAITLDGGGGGVASILVAGTNGITVAAGVNDVVTIRNIQFNGLGPTGASVGTNGIQFNSGAALILENVNVFGFSTWGIDFVPSGASELYVLNSYVTSNGTGTTGGGILIQAKSGGTASATLSQVKVVNNNVGIDADGEFTANPTPVSIRDSVSSGNTEAGVTATTTSGTVTMMIDRLTSTNNNIGVKAKGTGATVYLGNSEITGNVTGVSVVSSGSMLSYKTNEINGNTTDGTPLTAQGLN